MQKSNFLLKYKMSLFQKTKCLYYLEYSTTDRIKITSKFKKSRNLIRLMLLYIPNFQHQ